MESLQGSLLRVTLSKCNEQRARFVDSHGLMWTLYDTIRKENIKKELKKKNRFQKLAGAGCLFLKWTHWGLIALTKALHAPLWPTVEGDSGGNCQKSSAKVHAPGKSGNVK
jgi:hypothetical protein